MKKIITLLTLLFITINSFAQTSRKTLPKCGKYNIELKNDCHWWLASKEKWILGYILITDTGTQYFDAEGNDIDSKKVISYGRLMRRHNRHKCYPANVIVNKSSAYCNK